MVSLSRYQMTDVCFSSVLALICVLLFIQIKLTPPWAKEPRLYLLGLWCLLEFCALLLLSLEYNQVIRLPWGVIKTHHTLAILSLWGISMLQVVSITYTLARAFRQRIWWILAASIVSVQVVIVVVLTLTPKISTPIELACIAPFTTQGVTTGTTYYASRILPRGSTHAIIQQVYLGLFAASCEVVLIGLSISGYYEPLIFPQTLLYLLSSIRGYRLPKLLSQSQRSHGLSEIALTHISAADGVSSPHAQSHSSGQPPPAPVPQIL